MRICRAILALVVVSFAVTTIDATPVTWTLNNVNFENASGGISGSFVYDADTNTYSSVDLTSSISGGGYTFLDSFQGFSDNSTSLSVGNASPEDATTGELDLYFDPSSPLSDAGGTIAVVDSADIVCVDDGLCDTVRAFGNSGTVVSDATAPEPSTGLMAIGVGLLCVAGVRFRRVSK